MMAGFVFSRCGKKLAPVGQIAVLKRRVNRCQRPLEGV
jgi:hypothetical protein